MTEPGESRSAEYHARYLDIIQIVPRSGRMVPVPACGNAAHGLVGADKDIAFTDERRREKGRPERR